MDYSFTNLYIAGILGILAAGYFYVSLKWFEAAIVVVILSPWISALFVYDMTENIGVSETTYGSYIRVSLLIFVGCISFVRYIQTKFKTHEILPFEFKLLILFVCLALGSTFYSIDPFFTLVRAIPSLAFSLFLIAYYIWLTDIKKIETTLDLIFWLILIISLANFASLLLLGNRVWSVSTSQRFSGLWAHPNMMGSFCMASYPFIYWKFLRSKFNAKIYIIGLAAIMFLMHFLTGSRTSLLLSVFGISLYMILKRKIMSSIISLLIAVFGSILILIQPNFITVFERESKSSDSITTLTGRTDIWEASYQLIKENAITGYGFSVEGKIFEDYRFYNPELTIWSGSSRLSLHNGFISIIIGLGMFGLVIWIIILFVPYFRLLFFRDDNFRPPLISLMSMLFVSNFVESSISLGNSIHAVFFWFAWIIGSKVTRTKLMQTN